MNKRLIKSFQSITDKYDNYIFDCDGIVWRGPQIIHSAIEGINKLLDNNKRIFFLSNTNSVSREGLYEKLLRAGVHNKFNHTHTYTSSYLIAKHIQTHYKDINHIYLIGREGLEKELTKVGLKISGGYRDDNILFSNNQIDNYDIDKSIQAVVCGMDMQINYYKLFYAAEVIRRTGNFFGTNYDNRFNIHDKYAPGSYTVISALETCSETKAEIVTKPDPRSFEIISNDHKISKDKTIMIGDNPSTDILFANKAEIDSLLVLTGVTAEHMLENGLLSEPTYIIRELI